MAVRLSELDARMLGEVLRQSAPLTAGRVRRSLEMRELIERDFAEGSGLQYWRITDKGRAALSEATQ